MKSCVRESSGWPPVRSPDGAGGATPFSVTGSGIHLTPTAERLTRLKSPDDSHDSEPRECFKRPKLVRAFWSTDTEQARRSHSRYRYHYRSERRLYPRRLASG